jgi:predicted RNA-binding Zn-ribbon protein involved in translation (DUF1610 family)
MRCPECNSLKVTEEMTSPVSPYLHLYICEKCGWHRLRCGDVRCNGYMEAEKEYMGTVRYNCVKCGWTGTGIVLE